MFGIVVLDTQLVKNIWQLAPDAHEEDVRIITRRRVPLHRVELRSYPYNCGFIHMINLSRPTEINLSPEYLNPFKNPGLHTMEMEQGRQFSLAEQAESLGVT